MQINAERSAALPGKIISFGDTVQIHNRLPPRIQKVITNADRFDRERLNLQDSTASTTLTLPLRRTA